MSAETANGVADEGEDRRSSASAAGDPISTEARIEVVVEPAMGGEAGSTPPSVPRPTSDRAIGRYRLAREIASGGMATVYLAIAQGPGGFEKPFALKRIHPHLAQERQFVDMFLDEARIAALIDHPNVCGVVDFGEEDGEYWLAMEYLMGQPLSSALRRLEAHRGVEQERITLLAARMVADACEGLHAAHEQTDPEGNPLQIVHRDVSPHNLFVTWDGAVKVVDFGIARAANRVHHTGTGMVKGKFAYMAPEQMRGRPVDRRADVWSLGVLLWETVAGRPLFRRSSEAETVLAVTKEPAPPLAQARPGTAPELDRIVRRALALDPEARFESAREMGRTLERWLAAQDEPMGNAEVAEWMGCLFPDGEKRQRTVLRRALAEHSGERLVRREMPPGQEPSQSAIVRRSDPPAAGPQVPRARRGPLLAVAAVVAVAVSGAAMGVSEGPAGSETASASETAPASASASASASDTASDTASAPAPASASASETATETETETETETASGSETATESATETATESATAAGTEAGTASETATETASATAGNERARGPGVVNVAVRGGWADVYLGARHLGTTPGRFRVPAGRHVLTLKNDGRSRRVPVRVRPGRVTRVTAEAPR